LRFWQMCTLVLGLAVLGLAGRMALAP